MTGPDSASRYVHGTHAEEQPRLSTLNDLLNDSSLAALALRGGAREAVVGGALLDGACYDQTLASIRAWGARPDAGFWFARCWAEGARTG